MKIKTIAIAAIIALGSISAALAAEPVGTFPTDQAQPGQVVLGVGYQYSSATYDFDIANRPTLSQHHEPYLNAAQINAEVGLIKGVSISAETIFDANGHYGYTTTTRSVSGDFSGFREIKFGVKADLLKIISVDSPISTIVEYQVRPGGLRSYNVPTWVDSGSNDVAEHTGRITIAANRGNIRPYAGSELVNNATTGFKKTAFIGTDFKIGSVRPKIEYRYTIDENHADAYIVNPEITSHTINASADIKITNNIVVTPSVTYSKYEDYEFATTTLAGTAKASEFKTGVAFKVTF